MADPVPVAARTDAARRYHARKRRGVCVNCEAPAAPGRVRCRDCIADARADLSRSRKKQYAARKRRGVCVFCGRLRARPGYTECQPCRDRKAASQARRYARRRAAGVCVTCEAPAKPGRVRCRDCLATVAAAVAAYKAGLDKTTRRNRDDRQPERRPE